MKKLLFLISFLVLSTSILLFIPKNLNAQGTCTCAFSGGFSCNAVGNDNCDSGAGFVPQCEGGLCANNPQCTCKLEGEASCGVLSKFCCSGGVCFGDAICQRGFCTPPRPGGGGGQNALCEDGVSIDTAIGCIPVANTNEFIGFLLTWGIGIAGGVAFLLILFAGFQIITSGGDPKRLQAGKELLTAAIAGLLLLIFSVFILRIVGVNILGLPEFGG